MKHLVAIVGPTGAGKSHLAIHLALAFDGEIVNADSRQVYRHMDIGTAKPIREELPRVPHHLIDIVSPDRDFSLAQYQRLAQEAIEDIHRRSKLPLLVGGSGLYVWAVLEGWEIPEVPPDLEFRRRLQERATEAGGAELQHELIKVDPVAAQRIEPSNIRRIIRALEVHKTTGIPFSQLQHRAAPPYSILVIGLTAERAELYHRIDRRVDGMIELGLVDEVKRLLATGFSPDLPSMSGIGYRQIVRYLQGELTLAEAVQQMKSETHRLVRHQYNWFRLQDSRIKWFDITKNPEPEITELVARFLKKNISPLV